jgi:hypothetical protein
VRIPINLKKTYAPVTPSKCPHELRHGVHILPGALSTSTPARCPFEAGADTYFLRFVLGSSFAVSGEIDKEVLRKEFLR